MRLNIKTSPNNRIVPFDYQNKLVGVLHKWIGENDIHNLISLYSFSWLYNGIRNSEGLNFKNGASWFISFHDDSKLKIILSSILEKPEMFYGMRVVDVSIEDTPDLSNRELFYLSSPILIKYRNKETGKITHYTYEDKEASELLKSTLLHKMQDAGLPLDETLEIYFDTEYKGRKIKHVNYRNIRNKASMCPVYIKGKPETKAFAWNVGIGNSTGIGFGSIY